MLLALAVEALLILAVVSIGFYTVLPRPKPGSRLVSIAIKADNEAKPQPRQKAAAADPARKALQPQQRRIDNAVVMPQPAPAAPQPPAFIPIPRDQMAALDISRIPRQAAPPAAQKALMGPVDSGVPGDSKRVGSAPNGQPLYAAAWYREPTDAELAGYLSTADGPGYALIACRTAPEWRVENCVALDEFPSGSNLARAVLAAAWQFKVRPPRLGGVYKVGEWVRIRIDYEFRRTPRG